MGSKHKLLIIGDKYGRLTIVSHAGVDSKNRTLYRASCDCNKEVICLASDLRIGHKKSCGCLRSESTSKRKRTHGATTGGIVLREYTTWLSIKQRCYDIKHKSYLDYGNRGIKMCDRWLNSFENFLEDMGKRPSDKHSIDRIDVNGDYTPENCKWSTGKEQARNRRNNRIVVIDGLSKSLAEASEILGLNRGTLVSRLNRNHKNPFSKDVIYHPNKEIINVETGIYYGSVREAAIAHNIKPITLHKRLLRGYSKNNNLQYAI